MARPLPLRLARAAAVRFRDALARRTAPPVVTAVRAARLTRLGPGALADLHERVVEAERRGLEGVLVVAGDPGGGVAVVLADARSSAREVQVFGLEDRGAVTAALARHGFRPEATRVTLFEGRPAPDGPAVALAYVAASDTAALRERVEALAPRLVVGGTLAVDASDPADLEAVERAFRGAAVRYDRGPLLHVVWDG